MDFKLRMPSGTPGAKFCFALVERTSLRTIRDARWDLVRPALLTHLPPD